MITFRLTREEQHNEDTTYFINYISNALKEKPWDIVEGEGPIIAVANHAGNGLRDEISDLMALSEKERRREEDPYTDAWTSVAPTRLIAHRSRFEVDLNRIRHEAVYRTHQQAWGLNVWKEPIPDAAVERSLQQYDAYYAELHRICTAKKEKHGKFVILDLHSYNHRRDGPEGPAADPVHNPEVNIGTGTMDREQWAPLVDRFVDDLKSFDFFGRQLDVRENIKFVGRGFPLWTHTTFSDSGCTLAVEFKKFFMDEWTGELDSILHNAIHQAIESTIEGLHESLEQLGVS